MEGSPSAGAHHHSGGRHAPGLRVATHNIRGGLREATKLHLLAAEWRSLRLDVIFLQEVKVAASDVTTQASIRSLLSPLHFGILFGLGEKASGGVAVVVTTRTNLHPLTAKLCSADADGRLMSCTLDWGGHRLLGISTYLPAGASAPDAAKFVRDRLAPLSSASCLPVVMGGDFNFTMDWRIDRSTLPGRTSHGDTQPAAAMTAVQQGSHPLIDAYRHLHPSPRRCFTYHGTQAASRLDRMHLSASLLPSLESCKAATSTTSDHRPVVVHLRARAAPSQGRGLPRLHVRWWSARADLQAELGAFFTHEQASAPSDDEQALLHWWPAFKSRLTSLLRDLARRARAAAPAAAAEWKEAEAAANAAVQHLNTSAAPAALAAVLQTQKRCTSILLRPARTAAIRAKVQWLREGERPSPSLTRTLRPPALAGTIPALRLPSGHLVTRGLVMANTMARHYAQSSQAPAPAPAASAEVLAAVRASGCQLDPGKADAAGKAEITPEEVSRAAKRTQPGRAPGPDGVPTEVWLRGGEPAFHLLAALFTAIGNTSATPAGFLDGAVKPIFKAGDSAEAANYRPITLLNTDHRLLAKCLACRLSPLLAEAIGPEQAGFLTGRRGSDNILALQLLPAVLEAGRGSRPSDLALSTTAAVLLIDFAKAFDRVARHFLMDVMDALGARPGLLRWVGVLLGDTWASAVVNGWISDPEQYEAGVRQGCPLSPLLYLFVAWALTCFLRTCPHVGVPLDEAGTTAYALQFADDAEAFLRSLDEASVRAVLQHLETFGAASGQRVNPAKSALVPLGGDARAFPPSIAGIPVVASASVLGATITSAAEPREDPASWSGLVHSVQGVFSKLSKLSLSVFGRATAGASYGVSKLLFRAEHESLPASVAEQLDQATKALVDRKNGKLPGVQSDLLVGKPKHGGFGALPWKQHILARHAHAGFRFIKQLLADHPSPGAHGRPLWVSMAATLLSRSSPSSHPALALLAASSARLPAAMALPAPLRRMAAGLRALGTLKPIAPLPAPGPWCAVVPLWDNPHFCFERRASERTVDWPGIPPTSDNHSSGFPNLKHLPGLRTLADLLLLWDHLDGWRGECHLQRPGHREDLLGRVRLHTLHLTLYGQAVSAPTLAASLFSQWDPYAAACPLWEQVDGLLQAFPAGWQAAARSALPPTDTSLHLSLGPMDWAAQAPAVCQLLGSLGWDQPAGLGAPAATTRLLCPDRPLTVKAATTLQLVANVAARDAAHQQYVRDVLPAAPDARLQTSLRHLRSSMQQLWRVEQLENSAKETLWRLAVNGVRAAGGHGVSMAGPCPCGWAGPAATDPAPAMCWQRHHFWDCPVAQAVVAAVSAALPAGAPPLTRAQFWLLQSPQGVDAAVWPTVAALALTAMERGRSIQWALSKNQPVHDAAQTLITDFFPRLDDLPHEPPELPSGTAGRRAVAWFWCLVQDVAFTGSVPPPWLSIGADHPIFFVEGDRLRARLPPGVDAFA